MKHYVPCSAEKEWNLDGVLEKVWEELDLARVYTKPRAGLGSRGHCLLILYRCTLSLFARSVPVHLPQSTWRVCTPSPG